MLSLSSRAHYAALALTHLTEHYNEGGLIKSAEIAREENIPQSYLEQLMSQLCKSNIVLSHRGAQGGYRLARDPETITLRNLIEAVDGTVRLRPDVPSPLADAWRDLSAKVAQALDISLVELLKRKKQGS